MDEEEFDINFDINDAKIDNAIFKLTKYERLVKRVNTQVKTLSRQQGGSGVASSSSAGTGGLGELIGTLGGASLLTGGGEREKRIPAPLATQTREKPLKRTPNLIVMGGSEDKRFKSSSGFVPVAEQNTRKRELRTRARDRVISNTGNVKTGLLAQQGKSFAQTRGQQLAEAVGRADVRAGTLGRSALSGGLKERLGGAIIGTKLGGALGSIIPGAGTAVGMMLGMGIGSLLDTLVSKGFERSNKIKAVEKDLMTGQLVGSDFIKGMSTKKLLTKDAGIELLREGVSSFSLFGDLFNVMGPDRGHMGPGWSSVPFDEARRQQQQALDRRRTGGTSNGGRESMEYQRVLQAFSRLVME